jgi:hypothetical protein
MAVVYGSIRLAAGSASSPAVVRIQTRHGRSRNIHERYRFSLCPSLDLNLRSSLTSILLRTGMRIYT